MPRVQLLLYSACLMSLAACSSLQKPTISDSFPEPPVVRATDGVVNLTLVASINSKTRLPQLGIDSTNIVPTIDVRPGERILVTLENNLRPQAGHMNAMNLHFHGLQISPKAPGDEVLQTMAMPGQSVHYRIKIPADHPAGLYWYHPHVHGESFQDVTAGMSGAIIVEGLREHYPLLAGIRERLLILRDVPRGINRVVSDGDANVVNARTTNPCRPEPTLISTVNGAVHPTIMIDRGEKQFFRIINASAGRFYDLFVIGSRMRVLANDGVATDVYPRHESAPLRDSVLLPPGGRAEVLLVGPDRPSLLVSRCVNSGPAGDPEPTVVLARTQLQNFDRTKMARGRFPFAVDPPDVISKPGNVSWFGKSVPQPQRSRVINFDERGQSFFLNSKRYGMGDMPMFHATVGTVERWRLRNRTSEIHAFHIHQVHFLVENIGADGIWYDTLTIPPHTERDVLVDFRNPIVEGTFVFHCHLLDHEDGGMMAKIEVSPRRQALQHSRDARKRLSFAWNAKVS